MKTKKRLLPALVMSAFLGMAGPSQAATFSGVYVFGDSLSDAGYYRSFLLSLGLPAAVVAQLGSFTTNPDPVWAEILSQYYGFAPSPSNVNSGNIFAQGGARVAAPSASTPPGAAQRPVSTQIDEYLARSGGHADPNALYTIWAGGNDFLQGIAQFQAGQINATQLQTAVLGAATAEIQQIGRLQAAGARYIVVVGLPDIGTTPSGAAGGAAAAGAATQLSVGYNTTLFTGLASAGIRVIPVDALSFFADVRANAAAFGFTNTTGIACGPFPPITTSGNSQFCLPTNLVAPNANNTYFFADSVHPTGGIHRTLADFVVSLIEGPTQYSLLAETPLRTRASHVRSLSDGLAPTKALEPGRWAVFAGVDGGKFDIDTSPGNTGIKSTLGSLTVGVTARASESLTIGAAYGHTKSSGSFGQEAGGYSTRERAWSLFGGINWGGFYATGVFSNADVDFNDIRRTVRLGSVTRTATADTEGSNASAFFTAGYDFAFGRLRIGPTLAVNAQNVDVNGFDEAGAGSAGLRMGAQKRKSEVWSGGVRASYDLGGWTPWVRVTADRERRDDTRLVTATPLTMVATNSSYDLPAYQPDNSFTTGAIGISGRFGPRVGLSVAYYNVWGRSDIRENGLSALLAIGF